MAGRKKIRNKKCMSAAFSLLECLFSSSLLVLLILIISKAFLVNSSVTQQIELYLKYLNNAQYLYWYFNSRLSNNLCVDKIEPSNNFSKEFYDNVISFCVSANRLATSAKVEIFTPEEFIQKENRANYLIKKIHNNSHIIKINKFIFNGNNTQQLPSYFYIAQNSGLYELTNGRSEELLDGVDQMQISSVSQGNKKYYIFNFIFSFDNKFINKNIKKNINKDITKIAFMITTDDNLLLQ